MLKVAVVIAVVIAVMITVLLALLWWTSLKQPPAHALIIEKYYVCQTHKGLHGGIFGKGPTKKFFPSSAREWCWRWEWEEVTAEEFKKLASEWYGVNWSEESDWWRPIERL